MASISVTLEDETVRTTAVAANPLTGTTQNSPLPIAMGLTIDGKLILLM